MGAVFGGRYRVRTWVGLADGFTDRARYCPDLGEHPPETRFRHAFDMMAPYEPHSLAAWQLVHRSCRGSGQGADSYSAGTRGAPTRGGPIGDLQCLCSRTP